MFNRVNSHLLPIKAHYFLYNAATGPMMQFLPTIATQLKFSKTLIGTIFTILPISGLIAKPLFGGLADKYKLHKLFFIAFQAILAIGFLSINFIPTQEDADTKGIANANLTCDIVTFLELRSNNAFANRDIDNMPEALKDNASCNLSCTIKSIKDVQGLCKSWNISKYCELAKTLKPEQMQNFERLEFEALFNESHDVKLETSMNIRIFNASFSDGSIYETTCSQENSFWLPCRMQCPKVPLLNELIKDIGRSEDFHTTPSALSFRWFLGAAIISWIGMAVVVSIGDAICFDLLGTEKNREYGKQKMWGSIGVGIFGIAFGYLTDLNSNENEMKDYSVMIYLMLIVMVLDIMASSTLTNSNLDAQSEPSILKELWYVLREGRVLVFAWWCIGAGMCTGVTWNFLFIYTEEISTPSQNAWLKTLQGLLTGVQCFLGEMPFNFISGSVLRKVGHINVMSLVLLTYAIRFMAYSIITNPWMFLFVEVLHGPTVGLCWPTMVSYGDKVAPSGTKATIQGLVGAVFEGIGVAFGSLICGYLMDVYKGVVTFRMFSAGALVWLTVFWLLQLLLRRVKAYPLQQGHTHLASYSPPDDDILVTMSQEMQTY